MSTSPTIISPRVWGRVYASDGTYTWQAVYPDAAGNTGYVDITWLIQALYLNLGESPFYGSWGIPAQRSVATQVFPDFYVNLTQQRFATYFAALTVKKLDSPMPMYQINATLLNGTTFSATIPI